MGSSTRVRRWTLAAAGLCVATAVVVPAARIDPGESGSLVVGATVRPSARLISERHPLWLTVTREDLERGFVDVKTPSRLEVHANCRSGYVLDLRVAPRAGIVVTEIRGLGPPRIVAANGGRITRAVSGPVREKLELRWRFHLADSARPGFRAWPVQISIRPE